MRGVIRIALLLLLPLLAQAAPQFPALSGRVVDEAGLLSAQTRQSLTQLLAGHEQATGDQVVVVTLKSLQGYAIEDYGYQLGRYWGIGQKQKNNGVLLIVAPNEHKVRIEVGYGLEGVLTDAVSNQIINQVILPDFRAGRFELGITDGTKAILTVLGGGDAVAQAPVPARAERRHVGLNGLGWVFFIALGLGQLVSIFTRHRVVGGLAAGGLSFVLAWLLSALGTGIFIGLLVFLLHFVVSGRGGRYWGGGGFGGGGFGGGLGGGGFGGGGFSGGGGSFGGGGSSGGW